MNYRYSDSVTGRIRCDSKL